jgi:hypothetical protein
MDACTFETQRRSIRHRRPVLHHRMSSEKRTKMNEKVGQNEKLELHLPGLVCCSQHISRKQGGGGGGQKERHGGTVRTLLPGIINILSITSDGSGAAPIFALVSTDRSIIFGKGSTPSYTIFHQPTRITKCPNRPSERAGLQSQISGLAFSDLAPPKGSPQILRNPCPPIKRAAAEPPLCSLSGVVRQLYFLLLLSSAHFHLLCLRCVLVRALLLILVCCCCCVGQSSY